MREPANTTNVTTSDALDTEIMESTTEAHSRYIPHRLTLTFRLHGRESRHMS
jgi:hypothetical protein